jgi:hypothetical protein
MLVVFLAIIPLIQIRIDCSICWVSQVTEGDPTLSYPVIQSSVDHTLLHILGAGIPVLVFIAFWVGNSVRGAADAATRNVRRWC